ncbi:MAG: CPBP family intramembrane metalloprotease [Ancrocorticia sp.]
MNIHDTAALAFTDTDTDTDTNTHNGTFTAVTGADVVVDHPLPYHQLMRATPRSAKWWRPLAAVGVMLAVYVALLLLVLVFFAVLVIFTEVGAVEPQWLPTEDLLDPSNPMDLMFLLGFLALMIPAALLGMRWGGKAKGTLHSINMRVRWDLMLRAAAIVFPIFGVVLTGLFLLDPPADFAWPDASSTTFVLYAVIIALTPLQCAAEEYVFRGLPMQLLGVWLRSPLWGILIPVPFFILGHGYDWVGQIDLAVFAICMALLVWKTGGLELAIVMHTANNLILFLLAPLSSSATLEQGAVDPWSLLISLPLTIGVTALLWMWFSRKYGLNMWEQVRWPAVGDVAVGSVAADDVLAGDEVADLR